MPSMILSRSPDNPRRPEKGIGYWRGGYGNSDALPDPSDFVDPQWDPAERAAVAAYLDRGKVNNSFRGWSECRICGKHNGSQDLTDGVYIWPQGFSHYVRDHGVRPPVEFVQHALGSSAGSRAKVPREQDDGSHLALAAVGLLALGQFVRRWWR